MAVKNFNADEKVEWLDDQLKEIRVAISVVERFERLTKKWLKKAQEAKKTK